jgi:hypothetical protein
MLNIDNNHYYGIKLHSNQFINYIFNLGKVQETFPNEMIYLQWSYR